VRLAFQWVVTNCNGGMVAHCSPLSVMEDYHPLESQLVGPCPSKRGKNGGEFHP